MTFDLIALLQDHASLAGGLACFLTGPDIDCIPLSPGFFNVTSESGPQPLSPWRTRNSILS